MKILNPIKLLLVLTMLAVGFSSCEEDDETIYDYLIGRTWVGDLGFIVDLMRWKVASPSKEMIMQ